MGRRRRPQAAGFDIWPAFTDALGGLVVVLVFLITLFVASEVLVGREMLSRDTAIGQLQEIIEHLEALAGDAEAEAVRLREEIVGLQGRLRERSSKLTEAQEAYRALERAREGEVAELTLRAESLTTELERLRRALAGRETELTEAGQELQRYQAQTVDLNARIAEQAGQIEAMDALIKRRLLDRVEELERYASDFFGRLREVFADNPNIKVEGDRFVFQSEVLFPSGEAVLSPQGREGLDKFVEVYRQVADQLPPDLPVIIQVQGHTDRLPIRTARFASNWELSTARALDVVQYLIDQGIPPQRLAAVGMGEYHPISEGEGPESLRRNRRIELKITSR